jgi:hypothetical protein
MGVGGGVQEAEAMSVKSVVTCDSDSCEETIDLEAASHGTNKFWRERWLSERGWVERIVLDHGRKLIHACPRCVKKATGGVS